MYYDTKVLSLLRGEGGEGGLVRTGSGGPGWSLFFRLEMVELFGSEYAGGPRRKVARYKLDVAATSC